MEAIFTSQFDKDESDGSLRAFASDLGIKAGTYLPSMVLTDSNTEVKSYWALVDTHLSVDKTEVKWWTYRRAGTELNNHHADIKRVVIFNE